MASLTSEFLKADGMVPSTSAVLLALSLLLRQRCFVANQYSRQLSASVYTNEVAHLCSWERLHGAFLAAHWDLVALMEACIARSVLSRVFEVR